MNYLNKEKVINTLRETLNQYCDSIKFAFLFGSIASDTADIYSDIDVGIYFQDNLPDEIRNAIRFYIMDVLEPFKVDICYLDS